MLVTQSCLTPCDPRDRSPPDSSVHGILQARILYRVAISSSKKKNDSLRLHGLYSPGSSPGQNTGVGSFVPSPADLPNLGIELGSPSLQADSLPTELSGKPKNTGVGSLSLLQGIFPTQESNRGLLPCRQIQEIKLSGFVLVSFLRGWWCF